VLKAKPDAQLIYGVTRGTTPETFRKGIETGQLEPCLNFIPVKTGDHVCVPAGTLHAIMDGEIIAEIQQNSDTTYRVYDWNRTGTDGKPRQLHVEKALDVIDFDNPEPKVQAPALLSDAEGIQQFSLCTNEYFITEKIAMQPGSVYRGICDGNTLEIWGCIEGEATLLDEPMQAITFLLLPAEMGSYEIHAKNKATLLRAYLPPAKEYQHNG
jgi:mannose-6-phosphate isomerase